MGALVAVLQSDPNLMRCQVQRLDTHVAMTEPDRLPSAYGFGYYRNSDVLLGKRPSGAPTRMSLAQLAGAVDSEALVAHSRYATVGDQKDENTHPFRFRRWLFAHDGTVEAWGRATDNPVGGWYGLRNGYRGRFGMYMPPLLEALGLAELTHDARNNRMRAI